MANFSIITSSKLRDLLRSADPQGDMYVRILTGSRLVLGSHPLQPTVTIDLSKETVRPYSPEQDTRSIGPVGSPFVDPTGRRSGEFWFEFRGRRTACRNLKELLATGLRLLEEASPGTLEKLSLIKPKSKRIVAHDPQQLFKQEHLAAKHSKKLLNGWWIGTNNSGAETEAWLRRAAECTGYNWGEDCRTNLTGLPGAPSDRFERPDF